MALLTERTLERETAFSGSLLRLDRCTVELPNGAAVVREIVHHPDAVCAAVVTREGRLALVRQFRKPTEEVLVEVPAGKIDPGEDPDQAVLRELREEIGMVSGTVERLAAFYTVPGFCTERMTLYLVRDAVLEEACAEDDEFLETVLVDPAEALAMAADGRIRDAKTLVAVLAAARRLGLP